MMRLMVFAATYFTLRRHGRAVRRAARDGQRPCMPTIVSLIGSCAFRIFWIYCILPFDRTLTMLYISYPVSWILTSLIHLICCFHMLRKFPVSEGADVPSLSA